MLSATFAILLMSPFLMLRIAEGTGSFPKPLSAADEQKYIELFIRGDMEARNILIERNLRLVAHIIKN
jgi:RNA polymerase sporulation-specific sigma factor